MIEIELPDFDEDADTKTGAKRVVQRLADSWFSSHVRIAFTCVIVFLCLLLIGWNLSRLSILEALVAVEVQEFQLSDRLTELELELAGVDFDRLGADLESESDRVFQGFPELAAWAQGLSSAAQRRGVAMTYRVEAPHMSPIADILEVPVILEFKAIEQTADVLFSRSMRILTLVLQDHWHMDVVGAYAKGNGEQLNVISIRAHVWVRDRFGFVDPEMLKAIQSEESVDDQAVI